MRNKKYYILFLSVFLLSACDDMHDFEKNRTYPKDTETGKIYVLSEGLFNMNNSSLANYNFGETDAAKRLQVNFFKDVNKRGLGDTANDMQLYGNKIYVVVNVSSQIEVLDAQTARSIKQIPMYNEKGVARQPRYIDFFEGKAYVCSFDGTVAKIDTAKLEIEDLCKVGQNPDGICITNNKIYVSNSGGLSFPNYDSTVSVIDIPSFKEIKKIEVGLNPYKIHADSQGDVYVVTRGNYGDIGYQFHKIDSYLDEKIHTFKNLPAYNFEIFDDKAYIYNYDFSTGKKWVKVFDCIEEKITDEQFIKDKKISINTPYAISINPINNDVYIVDAQSFINLGDLLCFDKNGRFKFRINEVGLNPNHIIFLKK